MAVDARCRTCIGTGTLSVAMGGRSGDFRTAEKPSPPTLGELQRPSEHGAPCTRRLARRAVRWALGLAAIACALSASSRARAAPVPTRFEWVTTACPDDDFASRVRSRTGAVRFVRTGGRFIVRGSIERRGAGLQAFVRIAGPGGRDTVRQIASPNCEDALDALALVVAISLEARAGDLRAARRGPRSPPAQRREAPAPQVLPEPPAPPETVGVPEAPAPEAPAPETPGVPGADEPPREPPVQAEPPARPAPSAPLSPSAANDDPRVEGPPSTIQAGHRNRPWALGAGLSALASLGVAPKMMVGAELWLHLRWERDQVLSPEVILSFAHQRLDGFRQAAGDADFALNVGNLALCPVRFGSVVRVRPCATVAGGQFSSAGHRTFAAVARDRPWLAFGASVRAYVPLGPIELYTAAAAAHPVVRDSFRFGVPCTGSECADAFDRVDRLIWSGAAGLGVSF